ncbi:hypothetical protein EVA_13128, partial [gut metagenome]
AEKIKVILYFISRGGFKRKTALHQYSTQKPQRQSRGGAAETARGHSKYAPV